MGATSGAGTAYPSGTHSSPLVFSGVRVTQSLVLYVCFVDGFFFGRGEFSGLRLFNV
jgi:hypothetical protein